MDANHNIMDVNKALDESQKIHYNAQTFTGEP